MIKRIEDTYNEGENGAALSFCGVLLLNAPLVFNSYLIPFESHPCCLCRRCGISCFFTYCISLNTALGTYHAYAKFDPIYIRDVVTELESVLPHTGNHFNNPAFIF